MEEILSKSLFTLMTISTLLMGFGMLGGGHPKLAISGLLGVVLTVLWGLIMMWVYL